MLCDPWIEVLSRLGLFTSYQNKTGKLSKISAASAQQVAPTVAAYVAHTSDRPCWSLEVGLKEPKLYFTTVNLGSSSDGTHIYMNVKIDRWFRLGLLQSLLCRDNWTSFSGASQLWSSKASVEKMSSKWATWALQRRASRDMTTGSYVMHLIIMHYIMHQVAFQNK